MADKSEPQTQSRPTPLGIYDTPATQGVTGIEIAALVLTAIWLVGAAAYFILSGEDPAGTAEGLRFLVTMLAIFMPIAMIWVAATAARSSKVMREESARLQTAIDAIRQAYIAQSQQRNVSDEPSVARKLDEIAAATRKTETALATFETRRELSQAAKTPSAEDFSGDQPALALGTPAQEITPPLSTEEMIRALNFPDTAEDELGFAALRMAMRNRDTAKLIQASQDILTLLSQDGIYMDDLRPDFARTDIWRDFARGIRGRAVAALGGVRDRSALALTAGRMKQDPIFRDAAHHFLRCFDQTVSPFIDSISDADIVALSDTRTVRAFMLLGRVAGTFD